MRGTDPDDFLPDGLRATVETDVVDSVVVACVSTTVAAGTAVEDADAVSAEDCSGRAQPAATNTTAEKTPARERLVTERFSEQSEGPWVCAAGLSPTFRK
jgi:hypothetical protein